jgi:Tfp pilus assembly protein PilN
MSAGTELCSIPAKPAWSRGMALWVIVGALAMVAAAAAVQRSRRSLAALECRATAVDREWADAASEVQAAMDLRQTQQSVNHQAECAQTLLEKTSRSLILADVTNALPAGSWLMSFTLDSADVDSPADGVADENVRASVTGFAPSDLAVAKIVLDLQQSNLMHDVKLSACDNETQQGMNLKRFRIDLRIGGSDEQPQPVAQPTLTASIGH